MVRVVVVVVVKRKEVGLAEEGKLRRKEDLRVVWQRRGVMNMGSSRDGVITQTETLMGGASDDGDLLESTKHVRLPAIGVCAEACDLIA